MPNDEHPVKRLERDIVARHPSRDLEVSAYPLDGDDTDWEDPNADWWLTVSEDGEEKVGVDYKPTNGSFGVTRTRDDGGYPENPDKIFEGESAYDETLGEVDDLLTNPKRK